MKKLTYIYIPLLAVFLSSLLLLSSLDHKIYDLFLRALPSLTEDPSVLVVKIDDAAVEQVGLFPWPRDIVADAIILLKELGARQVIFDLNFFDKSPMLVDPQYIEEQLPENLSNSFYQMEDAITQYTDGVEQGLITSSEAPYYRDELLNINDGVKASVTRSVNHITRDVDAYFAKTLHFFGNSYQNFVMITQEDIAQGEIFDMSPYDLPWLEENIALHNIQADRDSKTIAQLGIIPTLKSFMSQGMGAGFVNAPVDPDGYLRSVHLLQRYNNQYYGQLTFTSMLEILENPQIEVNNRQIILHDAQLDGVATDIVIPRSQDGSILMKWPKKEFKDFNTLSAWDLISCYKLENLFIKNLRIMEEYGFFYYWDQGDTPVEIYDQAQYIKQSILDGFNMDGLKIEDYMSDREQFFQSAYYYFTEGYEDTIIMDVSPDDQETIEYVQSFFSSNREDLKKLLSLRERIQQQTQNSISFVGVDLTGGTDVGLTTFDERFPNVGLYSTLANMILSQEFIDDSPGVISICLALILALALSMVIRKMEIQRSLLVGGATLLVTIGLLLLYFMVFKQYIGVAVPITSLLVTITALSALSFFDTIREKAFLRSAFSRYLSPTVIEEIVEDPSKLNLGGEKREMTAIFTDIKGFSTIAEQLDPTDLVTLLNKYLSAMSDIIMENRGTIDKYEGDAIIAFFGAPIHMDQHAQLACKTALMMKKAEDELNEMILDEGLSKDPLFTRIGINTGEMIVGNMGTANKMDYTIMGNSVNLAARLEGINKQYDTQGILISHHTKEQLDDSFLLRKLDSVRVMGVQTPIRLYELLDIKSESDHPLISMMDQWDKAIELYENLKFGDAHDILQDILEKNPKDGVAQVFSKRCIEYMIQPPEEDWDGVFNLTQK
jgi:adenylate cyclase